MKTKRDLPVAVSPRELEQSKMSLARKELERNRLKQDARDAASSFSKQITELAGIVLTGKRNQEVDCEERESDTVNGAIETVRTDTDEVIETKAQHDADAPLFAQRSSKKPASVPVTKKGAASTTPSKGAGASGAFSTGKPGIGIGEDKNEYKLGAKLADDVRNGKTVHVPGKKKGDLVEILKLKKPAAKANGAGEAHA